MRILDNDIESIGKRYKTLSLGYVAKGYSLNEEKDIYNEAAELISKKYGDIINKNDIVDILSSKGRIITMVIKNREAFYEYRTGNIAIPHFLRLTTDLLHELVHKIGYLQKDTSFDNMNNVFKEVGTEYVSATSFSDGFSRTLIFDGVYGRFPEKTDAEFLTMCLVNQINQVVGGKTLEKSILEGKDYFKQAIIERWGEKYYINLEQNISDIAREERKYWSSYKYFSEEEKIDASNELKKHMYSIQDTILELEFSRRFREITDLNSAQKFLKDLKEFEENRARERIKKENENRYKDSKFEEVFSDFKEKLESQYGKLNIEYDESEWSKKYPKKIIKDEISEDERNDVLVLASEFKKHMKKPSAIKQFFQKVFNVQKKLVDENNTVDKKINKYIVENNIHVKEDLNSSNQEREKDEEHVL